MIPFQIESDWYQKTWYGDGRAHRRAGKTARAITACLAMVAIIAALSMAQHHRPAAQVAAIDASHARF